MYNGYLVLESGEAYPCELIGDHESIGEVVFNTSHSGYEEMATDPSYFSQILVLTAPMQGNYGQSNTVWESEKIWINGFACLDMQRSERDSQWVKKLTESKVPVVTSLDTRAVVERLRDKGTCWGGLVKAQDELTAQQRLQKLLTKREGMDSDWAAIASCEKFYEIEGRDVLGPQIAVLDFGSKKNIIRELEQRCRKVGVFPSTVSSEEVTRWGAEAIMLSNGPGDPTDVQVAVSTIQDFLGKLPVFGICMGHQLLSLALGAETYKLKFGHRGSNHPVYDKLMKRVYMTSQNHGYAVKESSLPKEVQVSHVNLNDDTVSGIYSKELRCTGIQFHPESHPGPHDATIIFDDFIKQVRS